jgi:hypothetical protein
MVASSIWHESDNSCLLIVKMARIYLIKKIQNNPDYRLSLQVNFFAIAFHRVLAGHRGWMNQG